jgi:flagellar hook protein FlgE
MSFNTALSGLRAASDDLQITGNNIANAGTIGFKSSRAEFGDVYASSLLWSGGNTKGSGVRLQDVAQHFSQGNISFTENVLDMAVSGGGFFVINQGGVQQFSRAGAFNLDNSGFLVNNSNGLVQGFMADANGNIGGLLGDIQIQIGNQPPRQTTAVISGLNLDSSEDVLARTGSAFSTLGAAIGTAQGGQAASSQTSLPTLGDQTVPFDYSVSPANFDITMAGATNPLDNGTVTVNLGVNVNSVAALATAINQAIATNGPIGVQAVAVDQGGGVYRLDFQALVTGDPSTVVISNLGGAAGNGAPLFLDDVGPSVSGVAAVNNGYPAQSIDITSPTGSVITYTNVAAASAAQVASQLNQMAGVSASASTDATLTAAGYINTAGNLVVTINGVQLTSNSLAAMEVDINSLTNISLPGITAQLQASGDLLITSSTGADLAIGIASSDAADSVQVQGAAATPGQTLDLVGGNANAVVGGVVDIILDNGYTAGNPSPALTGLFGAFTAATFAPVTINVFDPADPGTYNHATSMTTFDSLGNAHVMTQYFVKEEYDPSNPATSPPNTWTMYVLIDGNDVGDPDVSLPPPQNAAPTRAGFSMRFNQDGSYNPLLSEQVLISNWLPLDANGISNGSMGPQNVLNGGTIPVPLPPASSNFTVDMSTTSQFGSPFGVNNVDQDGYTTGRLAGLDVDDNGVIFARFTNGETNVQGQVALARFNNENGLSSVGDTMWAESFESGQPNIGAPNTAALGSLQASALEESNVDLSQQLVQLIIAQRNFQANAKTIETINQITQSVINLR